MLQLQHNLSDTIAMKSSLKSQLKTAAYSLLPMIIIIVADQWTKSWARLLVEPLSFGLFKFDLIFNNGVMLGAFSYLPLNIKEIVILTVGASILIFYFLGLWLLPIRSRATYIGLSLLVGGIMGNVIDRFNGFAVVDFLTIELVSLNLPYVNIADIGQWFGYGLIFLGLYRDSLYYWPKNDWRNKFIINPYFQVRVSLLIAFFAFASCTVTLVFSYAFFKNDQALMTLKTFFLAGGLLTLVFTIVTFLVSLVLSHRVAGPVYALKKHIENNLNGERVKFKLREFDEFKDVEKEINEL